MSVYSEERRDTMRVGIKPERQYCDRPEACQRDNENDPEATVRDTIRQPSVKEKGRNGDQIGDSGQNVSHSDAVAECAKVDGELLAGDQAQGVEGVPWNQHPELPSLEGFADKLPVDLAGDSGDT